MKRSIAFAATALLFSAAIAAQAQSERQPLRTYLQERHREEWNDIRTFRFGSQTPFFNYSVGWTDLDGDGRREAVVHTIHPAGGTGGGGIEIFTPHGHSWRLVGRTSIGHMPVRVLNTRTRGWRDLGIVVAGGGVIPGYEARLRFDGRAYPYNPSMPPAERLRRRVPGQVLIGRGDRGRPLF